MKENAPHPITLRSVFFTRTIVISIPGYSQELGDIHASPENQISVQKIDGEERAFNVAMRCVMNESMETTAPYFIDVECMAVFVVDETLSEEETARGVHITGHSVTYGAIRETVAWLTSRQANGPLMLGLSVLRPKETTSSS